jgi:hypothetical protein
MRAPARVPPRRYAFCLLGSRRDHHVPRHGRPLPAVRDPWAGQQRRSPSTRLKLGLTVVVIAAGATALVLSGPASPSENSAPAGKILFNGGETNTHYGSWFVHAGLILDFAGIEPNPARDGRVTLPRIEAQIVEPPSAEQVEAILARSPRRWRLPLRVLEQTGMRVGELAALEWRDVGKTATARRWVVVPAWLMVEVQGTCHPTTARPSGGCFPASPQTWPRT